MMVTNTLQSQINEQQQQPQSTSRTLIADVRILFSATHSHTRPSILKLKTPRDTKRTVSNVNKNLEKLVEN